MIQRGADPRRPRRHRFVDSDLQHDACIQHHARAQHGRPRLQLIGCDVRKRGHRQHNHQRQRQARRPVARLRGLPAQQSQHAAQHQRHRRPLPEEVQQRPAQRVDQRMPRKLNQALHQSCHRAPFSNSSSICRISFSSAADTFCAESAPRTRFFAEPSNARWTRLRASRCWVCPFATRGA